MKSRIQKKFFIHKSLALILLVGTLTFSSAYLVLATPFSQSEELGADIFQQQCAACHTIGGGTLVGPDLQDVTSRRDREWLVQFITQPDQMLADGDPTATQLLSEYNNIAMPNLSLTQNQVESILAYLETSTPGAQAQQPVKPLPPGDPIAGMLKFTGERSLQNGGIACMSCHNVSGIGGYGGGSLGPDLTKVYSRYGEAGLANSLQSIPFRTMQGIYSGKQLTEQERADLLAFFSYTDEEGSEPSVLSLTPKFWTWGVVGAIALFGVMALFWPRQRLSLSEKLRRKA
jgi:mono/diheme cytochrome c family protein